jgi:Sulfotransferase domain
MSKVFGIGLSRTGTTSLTVALKGLGYRAAHFPSDDDTRREVTAHVRAGTGPIELTILKELDALTDTPISCVYEGLDSGYPGSKFILTVRDRSSWLESCRVFWGRYPVVPVEGAHDSSMVQFVNLIRRHLYGATRFDKRLFATSYDRYVEGVRRHFRDDPARLLVMDICGGDGWDVLCPFLGLAIPEIPFPHEHRRPPSLGSIDGSMS